MYTLIDVNSGYTLYSGDVTGEKTNNSTESRRQRRLISQDLRIITSLSELSGERSSNNNIITYKFQIAAHNNFEIFTLDFYYLSTEDDVTDDIKINDPYDASYTGIWKKITLKLDLVTNPNSIFTFRLNHITTSPQEPTITTNSVDSNKLISYFSGLKTARLNIEVTIPQTIYSTHKYLTGILAYNPDDVTSINYTYKGVSSRHTNYDDNKSKYKYVWYLQLPTFDLNLITTDLSLLDNLSSVALVSDGIPATNISVFQMVVAESLTPPATDPPSDFGKSGNMYILVPKNAFRSTINASYEVIIVGEQNNYYVIGTGTSTKAYTSVNGGAGTSSEDTKFGHYFLLVIDKSILSDVKNPTDPTDLTNRWNFKIIYETGSTYYDITEIFQKNNIVSFDGITQNLYDYKDRFTYIPEERGMLSEPNIVNSYWYIGVKGGSNKIVKMIPT